MMSQGALSIDTKGDAPANVDSKRTQLSSKSGSRRRAVVEATMNQCDWVTNAKPVLRMSIESDFID
jgi:hypothetical protein